MDETQIIAYLQGELSSEEANQIEKWIAHSEANAQFFARTQKLWQATKASPSASPDVDKAWRKVQARVGLKTKVRSLRPIMLRAAASVLILIAAYALWQYIMPDKVSMQIAKTGQERKTINLPDGTQVWLNQYSQITYPKEFKTSERKIKLSGEAYFEVTHNPNKPFLIESGNTEVKVLGTSFNLMAYPDSSRIWVQVNTGRVAFYPVGQVEKGVRLQKGETGLFNRSTEQIAKTELSDPNLLAWQSDTLIFKETPCIEVFNALEKTFQIKIIRDYPAMPGCTFNGTYEDQTVNAIMQSLAFVFNLELVIDENNKVYTLRKKDKD